MRLVQVLLLIITLPLFSREPLSLIFWDDGTHNFGDMISKELVERIVQKPINAKPMLWQSPGNGVLAIGSILHLASDGDVIWGSGYRVDPTYDRYHTLDVRAVRGPLTRELLLAKGIDCPEIYGDPALLIPRFFPEFKKEEPIYDYIVIPHYYQASCFIGTKNLLLPTESWKEITHKILQSKLVISSSLHGIIIAEAFGIPARLLRSNCLNSEPLFKYQDYYYSTGRPDFNYARTINEALAMGGERPPEIDLDKLLQAFPYECFENNEKNQ